MKFFIKQCNSEKSKMLSNSKGEKTKTALSKLKSQQLIFQMNKKETICGGTGGALGARAPPIFQAEIAKIRPKF